MNMMVYEICMSALAIAYALLILYFYSGWIRLKEVKHSGRLSEKELPRVTVVIAARNEAAVIRDLIQDIIAQEYPAKLVEIIVVDDFSSDQTAQLAKNVAPNNVKVIALANYLNEDAGRPAHKKVAIETAVKQASGELIVTTDADCRMGPGWIKSLVNYHLDTNALFIAGPVSYFYDASFLGKFQTLDFLSLVGIGAASIRNGFYNICNGANLMYTKAAFLSVNGYENASHTPSGDDMMLMHKIGKKFPGQVNFLKDKNAIVSTYTAADFSTFWQQRLRWTSKSTHYEDKRITLILALVYVFNLSILIHLIFSAWYPELLRLTMWQFMIKIVVDTFFSHAIAKFFHKEQLLWSFLPIQLLHIAYIIIVAPASIFLPYYWKGRKV